MKVQYIEYVENSIGNNFGDHIELNKALLEPKYKNLHDAILNHELGHTKSKYSNKDFIHDLNEHKVKNSDLINFLIHNPKSWTQFLPFYFSKKHGFVIDYSLCIVYVISISVISLAVFFALRL